uniref:aminotransferase class I/II-fold pyridoxal phosphate-dependent enzyme n=1 Tax=Rhodococcus qingshengii TaxID=334542 RepID=UPI001C4E052E
EGYLDKRQGSGTYVADTIAAQTYTAIHAPGILPTTPGTPRHLSERGNRIAGLTRMPLPSLTGIPAKTTAFQIGLPALSDFPFDLWARLYSTRLRRPSSEIMRYSDPAGYRPLREAITSHIAASRGIRCTAKQVVVVSGSQQALEFSARMLLDPGDPAWIEDPCYLGTKAALVSSGAQLVPIPVDDKGIDVATGIDTGPAAKIAVVTPSHQFPLGTTMAL